MEKINKPLIKGTVEYSHEVTPFELAKAFWCMESKEQAQFFDHLFGVSADPRGLTEGWTSHALHVQLAMLNDHLSIRGRKVVSAMHTYLEGDD